MTSLSVESFKNANIDSSVMSASSTITAINRFNQFLGELEKKYPRPPLHEANRIDQKYKNFSFGATTPSNFQSIKEEVDENDLCEFNKTKGIQMLKQVAQSVYSRRKTKEKDKTKQQQRYHSNESVQRMLDRMTVEEKKKELKLEKIKQRIEKENELNIRNAPLINPISTRLGRYITSQQNTTLQN